jgi:hypothetical protein
VRPETLVFAERVAHAGDRLVAVFLQHRAVRNVVRNLAQAVHVVGNDQEPGRDGVVGEGAEGGAHHRGTRRLAEGAEVRQARRAVTAHEHDGPAQRRERRERFADLALPDQRRRQIAFGVAQAHAQQPREDVTRLGESPRTGLARQMGQALKHGASGVMGGPARVNGAIGLP